MKYQRLTSRANKAKKSAMLQRNRAQRSWGLGSSSGGLKSIYIQTSPRTSPEVFASALVGPSLSGLTSASHRVGVTNHLRQGRREN